MTLGSSEAVTRAQLEVLAGSVLDLLKVLDGQARAWLIQKHPEVDAAIVAIEDTLVEFHCEHADDGAWYRARAEVQKGQFPVRQP